MADVRQLSSATLHQTLAASTVLDPWLKSKIEAIAMTPPLAVEEAFQEFLDIHGSGSKRDADEPAYYYGGDFDKIMNEYF